MTVSQRRHGSSASSGAHREPTAGSIRGRISSTSTCSTARRRRVDRRNVQDIFVPLYDHQIPPGAAAGGPLRVRRCPAASPRRSTIEVKLQYRKFDATSAYRFAGRADAPALTSGHHRSRPPPRHAARSNPARRRPATGPAGRHWERWNDYGIGLLLEGNDRQRQGRTAPGRRGVRRGGTTGTARGPAEPGPRLLQGRAGSTKPRGALRRASTAGAPPWTVAWLSGLVNKENGHVDRGRSRTSSACSRRGPRRPGGAGFDFSMDYEVINELGLALFERAKLERGPSQEPSRRQLLREAAAQFERTLQLDAENVTAHYVLALIYGQLGEARRAAEHAALHAPLHGRQARGTRAIADASRLANPPPTTPRQSIVIYPICSARASADRPGHARSVVAARRRRHASLQTTARGRAARSRSALSSGA